MGADYGLSAIGVSDRTEVRQSKRRLEPPHCREHPLQLPARGIRFDRPVPFALAHAIDQRRRRYPRDDSGASVGKPWESGKQTRVALANGGKTQRNAIASIRRIRMGQARMKTATGAASNSVFHQARTQPVAEPVRVFVNPPLTTARRQPFGCPLPEPLLRWYWRLAVSSVCRSLTVRLASPSR
jgi:hypothetical protein